MVKGQHIPTKNSMLSTASKIMLHFVFQVHIYMYQTGANWEKIQSSHNECGTKKKNLLL